MAIDPQPVGHITVRAAFLALLDRWSGFNWNEAATRRNQDTRKGEMLIALAAGELTAKVFMSEGVKELPTEAWSDWWFPERMLFGDDIPAGMDDWARYAGHTPFLERAEFDAWLKRNTPASRRAGAVRRGYLTPDEALNWLMWQDYRGDTLLRSLEATAPNGPTPFMPLSEAMAALMEFLTSSDGVAVCTDAATGETIFLKPKDFNDPHLVHTDAGHVVTQQQHERQPLIARGHWNLLRLKADALIDALTPDKGEWNGMAVEVPTIVVLERDKPSTSWIEAALWVGNGAEDGETAPGALESGSARLIEALAGGRLSARGKWIASDPEAEGHGYMQTVRAQLWEGAALVDDPSIKRAKPRVYFRLPTPEKDELDSEDDPGPPIVGLYLPDRLTPSYEWLEVPTAELIAIYTPNPDSWVQEYVAPKGGGRSTAQPLLIEKMKRRHAEGVGFDYRPDEYEFLSKWVNDPQGVPQQKGWPSAARRTIDGMDELAREFAAIHAQT